MILFKLFKYILFKWFNEIDHSIFYLGMGWLDVVHGHFSPMLSAIQYTMLCYVKTQMYIDQTNMYTLKLLYSLV